MSSQKQRSALVVDTAGGKRSNYGSAQVAEHRDEDRESLGSDDYSNVSYRQLVLRYLLVVPASSALTFGIFILVFALQFAKCCDAKMRMFELCVLPCISGVMAWAASHSFQIPLWSLLRKRAPFMGVCGDCVRTFCQVLVAESLRLVALRLSEPHHRVAPPTKRSGWCADVDVDLLFAACWVALGWAGAEVVVGVTQGYQQLTLYRDMLPEDDVYFPDRETVETPLQMRSARAAAGEIMVAISDAMPPADGVDVVPYSLRQYIDEQVDELLRLKYMAELEARYGMPIPDIPIFVTTLQRIDSIFTSFGLTLILSSALRHAPRHFAVLMPTFTLTVLVHFVLSLLWTGKILPRIGVHVAAYLAFMGSFVAIWAGLWRWGVLE